MKMSHNLFENPLGGFLLPKAVLVRECSALLFVNGTLEVVHLRIVINIELGPLLVTTPA